MPELLVTERKIARYGFRRGLARPEPVADTTGLKVLPEVDPRPDFKLIIENQWACGSCTANATANCFRWDSIKDSKDSGPLCRLQIYWGERKIEGSLGQGDTGAEGHDAFTVARQGICPEKDWAYSWVGMTEDQAPPEAVFDPAQMPVSVIDGTHAYKLVKPVHAVPQSETAIKQVLSNHQTIAIGFTVYESFESNEVATTGIMPVPGPGEQILGGHEVLIIGYLKSHPHYALVANSWGGTATKMPHSYGKWGLDGEGFFLMPWSVVLDRNMTSDLRTIVRAA